MNHQDRLARLKKYYAQALRGERLKLTLDNEWLTVEVKTPLTATPSKDGYKYTLVCAQDMTEYNSVKDLMNRINLMLVEQLINSRQDVNIMYQERIGA